LEKTDVHQTQTSSIEEPIKWFPEHDPELNPPIMFQSHQTISSQWKSPHEK
jgi:hypothetical protein